MSLLDTLRPLGGIFTVTGQSVRSLAGVVLAKCIFDSCTFSTNGTGIRVKGPTTVSQNNYFDSSSAIDLGGDGILTIGLIGDLPTLYLANNYNGWFWKPMTVTLTGTCPTISLYAGGNGGQAYVDYTAPQTAPVTITLSGSWDAYCGITLPNCTDVTINDEVCSGFYLNAPNATAFAMPNNANAYNGWTAGLSITLGATSFAVPALEIHGSNHSWQGPFDAATVNALLASYANSSYGTGWLTIGGAAPTGQITSVTGLGGGYGEGFAAGDTATVDAPSGSDFVFRIDAVDENGSPTAGTIENTGDGYPLNLGTFSLTPLVSATGTGGFGSAYADNAALTSLLSTIAGVTTN